MNNIPIPTARPRTVGGLGVLVVLGLALAGQAAQACYSGLVIIPTADLVPEGEYALEAQLDGAFSGDVDEVRIFNTQFGVTPRLELGLDFDLSEGADTCLLLNAKYLVVEGAEHRPAVALGLCNVGSGRKATPYLVATHDFGLVRGHAGAISLEGTGRWFVGLDHAVNGRLTLMADYTNGSENAASVGCNYQFTDRFGALAGVLLPNASDGDTGFSLHFVLTGPIR